MLDTILAFLNSNNAPIATTEILNGLDIEVERVELYDRLSELEARGLISRSFGVEANGHTICFTWVTL